MEANLDLFTSKEEHRLRMFESSVVKKVFGPWKEDATGGWRKFCNEELHDLYANILLLG
jgi:hypothetical protein